jgi:hypothetical protein
MPVNVIQWPINPTEGDVYQSSNGDFWLFDGCAWISTCCSTIYCDPLTDGIVMELVFDGGEIFYLPLQPLQYGSITTWVFYIEGEIIFYAFKTINGWEILNNGGGTLCTLNDNSQYPISNSWTIDEDATDISSISTSCGSSAVYCGLIESEGGPFNTPFFPAIIDSEFAFTTFSLNVIWDEDSSSWILIDGIDILATILGNETTWPVGVWTPVDPSVVSFETFSEPCECDPYTNGLTLIGTGPGPSGISTGYAQFDWGGTSFTTIPFNDVLIEEISGTFYYTVGGTAEASAPSPLGPWDTSIGTVYDTVETVCGELPSTTMCVEVNDGETISSYSLTRTESDAGVITFTNFNDDIEVLFDDINNEWNIIIPSGPTTIGTVSGTSMGPWNEGDPITTNPPYTITINEGYC